MIHVRGNLKFIFWLELIQCSCSAAALSIFSSAPKMAFIGSALPSQTLLHEGMSNKCICTAAHTTGVKAAAAAAAAAAVLVASVGGAQPAEAALFHFRGERPTTIGLRSERYLALCPATPNCISSMGDVVRERIHYGTLNDFGPEHMRTFTGWDAAHSVL